jgi:SAM-dependent methyltransferase
MADQLKPARCRVCGLEDEMPWYTVREMMFGFRDEFVYFQCTSCQCLQIERFPENISKYYPPNYYSLAQNDEKKFTGIRGKLRKASLSALVFNKTFFDRILQQLYSPISLRVLKDIPLNIHSRILDVGCGSGHKFLYPLAELQFRNLAGCDPFLQKDIEYENGLKIFRSDIFGMTGEWDVISFHHVFEHVPEPLKNLVKVKTLLRSGGICVLRMPTVSSYAWEHYKVHWVQLDAPRHYFLHSIASVKYLAEKAGLDLFKIDFDSTYKQFSESERYKQDKPMKGPREKGFLSFLRRKINKRRYEKLAVEMNARNLGDQAAFFLKKP